MITIQMPLIIIQTLIRMKVDEKMDDGLEMLKERTQRCVCKYCGGKLEIRRIIFNDIEEVRLEIFCEYCDRIEFGVEPEIFKCAESFVDNLEFNHYPELDNNTYTHRMNIAKVCEIFTWGCRNLGILDNKGFRVVLDQDMQFFSDLLVMASEDITVEND